MGGPGATRSVFIPDVRSVGVRYLVVGFACIIAVGIFFRAYHIDRKVYWDDEIYTSIHILGLTEAEIVAHAQELTTTDALSAVIHPGHAGLRPIWATITSLATEDPQHLPAYYLLGRLWVQLFGDSILAIRTLSVVIGLLCLPCMYWLCTELFHTRVAALMGTALLAVSPISVLFSQEAREYGLWTLVTLILCALFLRAQSRPATSAWVLYALAVAVSIYVYPLSVFVAAGNFVYLFVPGVSRRPQRLAVAAATTVGLLSFIPWSLAGQAMSHQVGRSMAFMLAIRNTAPHLVHQVLGLVRLSLLDFDAKGSSHRIASLTNLLAELFVIAILAFLCLFAYRTRDGRIWPYIAIMMLAPLLPFFFADLVLFGNRTGSPRYFMPLYIGLDLAFVYLFVAARSLSLRSPRRTRLWATVFAIIFICRIGSCARSGGAETWWTKYDLQAKSVARIINRSNRPLLLSDHYIVWSLVMSNYLKPGVRFQLRPRCYLCSSPIHGVHFDLAVLSTPDTYSDVFLLGPSKELQHNVTIAMASETANATYHCIELNNNCASALRFW